MNLLDGLKGYKTKIVGVIVFAVAGARAVGWIEPELADQILVFLGGAGLLTVRSAITNLEKK